MCGVCPGGAACLGVAGAAGVRRASAVPGGGACLLCRLLTLPLAYFFAPIPQPPSRREGGDFLFSYARGFAPCIPGAEPGRHWFAPPLWKTQWGACPGVAGAAGVSSTRRGACLLCRLPALPLRCPRGGVPALSPVNPALTCFLAPIPRPPSRREGGDYRLFFARGCAPCIPGAEPGRHWLCLWETGSLGFVVAPAPAGATGTRVVKTNCPRGTCMAETVSAASGLMPGCRGRQPPAK